MTTTRSSNLGIVFSQLGLLLLSIVTIYAVVLIVTLLLVPREHAVGGMDTGNAGNSLYITEPKYVFLGRSALNTTSDKIIMLGASNVVAGFRQAQLQKLLPDTEVSNLGVGGSNMTEVREIADAVQEVQSPEARQHNTFVIGIWYGLFANDAVRWNTPDRHAGDTDIDIERYRYGFYRRGDHGPIAVLPPRYLDVGTTLIHPMLVIDRWTRDLTRGLRQHISGKHDITDAERDAAVVSEAERKRYLDFWADYMGHKPLGTQQFDELARLIDSVVANGGRVVLVDLPLPAWHAHSSPWFAEYEQNRRTFLAGHGNRSGLTVVGMGNGHGEKNGNNNDDFSDEVHPKPRVARIWATQLAAALDAQHANSRALALSQPTDRPAHAIADVTTSFQRSVNATSRTTD